MYKKEHYKLIIVKFIFLLLVFLLSFLLHKYFLILLPLIFIDKTSNKIIKFKWSKRIKRQFLIFEIVNITMFLFTVFNSDSFWFITLSFILNLLLYWLAFLISVTVEKIIQLQYIKQAKTKLKKYNVLVIAITGSYGKTSCKNYIYDLLKNDYNVLATPKSYNTLNGLLKTINNDLKTYHEIFIAEIGVDHKNAMDKYIKLFDIDIGVVTKIGNQHIKTFKTIENIQKEKNKILNNSKRFAIINLDDPLINKEFVKCNKIQISTNKANNYDINVEIEKIYNNKTFLNITIFDKTYSSHTTLLGKHNLENLACAIGVAKALNVDDNYIIQTIKKLKNVEHRLSISYQNNWTIIDDSYNSNIIGFINALDVLKSSAYTKVLITPGIIEQKNNEKQDAQIANKIIDCCDLILLINSPSFGNKIANKLVFNSFKDAYNYLINKYHDAKLTILIENDLPDIFLK